MHGSVSSLFIYYEFAFKVSLLNINQRKDKKFDVRAAAKLSTMAYNLNLPSNLNLT